MSNGQIVPDPKHWRALAPICVAFFIVALDVSIVNVALPSIAVDLNFEPGHAPRSRSRAPRSAA